MGINVLNIRDTEKSLYSLVFKSQVPWKTQHDFVIPDSLSNQKALPIQKSARTKKCIPQVKIFVPQELSGITVRHYEVFLPGGRNDWVMPIISK